MVDKAVDTQCYHCGDICDKELILFQEKSFCCAGCKNVFQILDENNLSTYYELNQHPGSTSGEQYSHKFDFLDDASVMSQIVDFQNEEHTHITFHLPQIHCASCIWLLENLYKLNPSVTFSKVNFLKRKATVHFKHQETSLKELVILLSNLGYEPKFSLSDTETEKNTKSFSKRIYYQLGISGFAFGNIMFLSLPEYLTGTHPLESTLGEYFGLVSFILSIPVLLFGALDYLKSAYIGLKHKTINMDVPISLGIISLFVSSSYEVFSKTGSGYFDSFAGLIFFLLIGKLFQNKTFHSLSFDRDYKSYFPISVRILREKQETTIPLNQLKKGERILVKNKELIPADAIVLSPEVEIDYSFVTGESVPVKKMAGELIFSGGHLLGRSGEFEVVKNVDQSYLTQLWNNATFTNNNTSKLEIFTNRLSTVFTVVVLSLAIGSFFYWYQADFEKGILSFTSVLIIACPCALALSIPFAFGNLMRIFSKHDFYLKNVSVIERIAKTTAIIFDKTGTLTESNQAEVSFHGKALTDDKLALIKSAVKESTHPYSQHLYAHLSEIDDLGSLHEYDETPGAGLVGKLEGNRIKLGSAKFLEEEQGHALGSHIHISINERYLGYFSVQLNYRSGLDKLIKILSPKFLLGVLSGDNNQEEKRLRKVFGAKSVLSFNQSPQEKLDYIKSLQDENQVTMMLGDGLNDAGALQQSDVGISITNKLSQFTPASDVILHAKRFDTLPQFIKSAQWGNIIVYISFGISFAYNFVGLYFAMQGMLSPIIAAILMPLSSFSVVLFTTVSTWIVGRFILSKTLI